MKPLFKSLQRNAVLLFPLLAIAQQQQSQYSLEDDYSPSTFSSQFTFFTGEDPTHGFVNYISSSAASASGIFSTSQSSVHLGVESNTVVGSGARGRDSVRVESVKSYNAGSLFILDAKHMPVGCGTWPAFWLYGPNWPSSGEIDIIEGVNNQAENSFAAHTGPGCSVSTSSTSSGQQAFLGQLSTSNCDVNAPNQAANAGCGIKSSQGLASYGTGFNSNGGGVYAAEWTSAAISIWFFPRGSIPSDITAGNNPNPSSWGVPQARFGTPSCDINQHFKDQRIVLNTALCGDWAGGVWSQDSTCSAKASTCEDFVRNNPQAFRDAYWEINSLKVYQANGGAVVSTTATAIVPATSTSVATSIVTPSTFSTVVVTTSQPTTVQTSVAVTTTLSVPTTLQTTQAVTASAAPSATTAAYTTPSSEAAAPAPTGWSGWGQNPGWHGQGDGPGNGGRPAWGGSGYGGRGGGRGGVFGPP